jgi:TonB family protein
MPARSHARSLDPALGAAVAASLALHAAAITLSFPVPRASWPEAPPALRVFLAEAPVARAALAEPPAPPERRVAQARRRLAPDSHASTRQPLVSPPATAVEEKVVQPPASIATVDLPPPQPAAPPAEAQVPAQRATPPRLLAAYGKTIAATLARHTQYPPIARMQGWEGLVTMQLRVAATGRLLDAAVHQSSGHGVLDREALAMAARAERFPPPAGELEGLEVAVLVPVVFRLER